MVCTHQLPILRLSPDNSFWSGESATGLTSVTVRDTLAKYKLGRDRVYLAQNSRLQPITKGNQGRSLKASLFVITIHTV